MTQSKEFLRAAQPDMFIGSNLASGVAPGTALSTAPPLSLWNPPGSGRRLVLIDARCGYVSGTLGAGFLAYGFTAQATEPSGGTNATSRPSCLASGGDLDAHPAVGRAKVGSTLAATPTLLRPALILQASAPFVPVPVDRCEGDIIIPPGYALCLQGIAAAGTSPLVVLAMTWLEVRS